MVPPVSKVKGIVPQETKVANPDPKLRRLAKQRAWPIETFY
jgi:hypothetical protein